MSGCSSAAKCPPRLGSPQCRMSTYRLAAQRREGRGTSLGKMVQPVGAVTTSVVAAVNHEDTSRMLSQ